MGVAMDKKLSEYFSRIGRKGARKQSAAMTPEARKRRAWLAAKVRWDKAKGKK